MIEIESFPRTAVETLLRDRLDAFEAGQRSESLRAVCRQAFAEPIQEFLSRPSKFFRARLVHASWIEGGGTQEAFPKELAFLVEILHSGSLIADDIQDEATVRRGQPTFHALHGVPLGINTAGLLYSWPFEILADLPLADSSRHAILVDLGQTLFRCHQGQSLDLTATVSNTLRSHIEDVVETTTRFKTGQLFEFCARLGARAAQADDATIALLSDIGRALGRSLQMLDDLSGILLDSRRSKGHEDLRQRRLTWAWSFLSEDDEFPAFARSLESASSDEEIEALRIAMRQRLSPAKDVVSESLETVRTLALSLSQPTLVGFLEEEVERLQRSFLRG